MAIGVTVGFMPVPAGGATAPAAAAQGSAGTESPLGLFDALLQIATAFGASSDPQASVTTGEQAALATAEGQQLPAAITTTTSIEAQPTGALGDLLDQLTILSDAVESEAPIELALETQVVETLDAVAAALGLEGPADAEPDAAAAAFSATVAVNALAAPAATSPSLVPSGDASVDLPSPAIVSPTVVPIGDDPGVSSNITPNVNPGIAVETARGTDPPVVGTPKLPETIEDLASKIAQLASALEEKSPGLSARLEAFATQIRSGAIDISALTKLGLELRPGTPEAELAAAIDRLLAPPPETKPTRPLAFTAATLALPEVAAVVPARPAQGTQAAPDVRLELDSEPDPDPRAATDARVEARAEKPDAVVQRSFAPAAQAQAGAAGASAADVPQAPATTAVAGPQVTAAVAADTKAIHAAYRAPVQQINIPQIAFEIVRQVEAGVSRFQIRIDPPELGRVDVKLDVDKAGNVTARMTVERAETLDLMQRDQRTLERALAQAGLDGTKTNLEFSLRQNPFARDEQQQHGRPGNDSFPRFGVAEADEPTVPAPHILAYRGAASAGGVNLFV